MPGAQAEQADEWLSLLSRCAGSVRDALGGFTDWSAPGDRPDQYRLDQVADGAALSVLRDADVAVLSEESGITGLSASVASRAPEYFPAGDEAIVIIDPVDGSTNASRRIPYYCCSICVLDADGFAVGLVLNLVDDTTYTAVRGQGAWRDGVPLNTATALPPPPERLSQALIASNGALPAEIERAQSRTTGSAALDLCGVAEARFDAFVDTLRSLRVWDYAAGALICQQADASVWALDHPLPTEDAPPDTSTSAAAPTPQSPLAHASPTRRLGPVATRTSPLLRELLVVSQKAD